MKSEEIIFKFAREIKNNKKSLQKMKPKNEQKTLQIFKVLLEEIINKAHPLVKLSETISRKNLEEKLSEKYTEKMSAPIFGQLKSNNRLERNLLKGNDGDHINAVLAACGFNLRKLYAVFFLPILKWLDNRITERYFPSLLKQNYQPFGYVQNK